MEDARRKQPARREAHAVLSEVLASGAMAMKDVYEQADLAGVNKETLKNAIRDGGSAHHKWAVRRSDGSIEAWWLHLMSDGVVKGCSACDEKRGFVVRRVK